MKKPLIGVISSLIIERGGLTPGIERTYVNDDYVQAIYKSGGCPIILPVVDDKELIDYQTQLCDGLIFTGGYDIHPKFYNSESHVKNGFNYSRVDQYQIEVMKKALEYNKPSLCICRGLQLLNVVCGGSLNQDVSEAENKHLKHLQECKRYEVSHKVKICDNTVLSEIFNADIWVNSFHHQCIKELGKDLKALAITSDGIIEAVEHVKNRLFIGVQWHPEMMITHDDSMLPLFEILIKEAYSISCR